MPNTNDLSTDSAVSQLTVDLCRELYDRFVMGGWMPQDAHAQTEAMIRQCFDTPAADAGPRQPLTAERIAEIVRTPLSRQESIVMMTEERDAKHARKLALSEIPGSMLNDGITEVEVSAARPVPQEAAPQEVLTRKELIAEIQELKMATAPDSAMRVARLIVPSVHENYAFDDTLPEREAVYAHVAALIREAGSERERELTQALQKYGRHAVGCKYNDQWAAVCDCGWPEASRLMGGESK